MEMEQGMSVVLVGREFYFWEYSIQFHSEPKQFSGRIIQQTTGEACAKMLIGHPLVNSWPTHHLLRDNAAWGTQASEPLQIVALLLIVLFTGVIKCTRSLCLTAPLPSWATHDVKPARGCGGSLWRSHFWGDQRPSYFKAGWQFAAR